MDTTENNSGLSDAALLAGKTIAIQDTDICLPGPLEDSEQGLALMLARRLYYTDDYTQGDFINMSTGIGVSPEFHELLREAAAGALRLREMAAICFLAGRLSLALGQQR